MSETDQAPIKRHEKPHLSSNAATEREAAKPTSEIADLLDGAAIDALAVPEFRVLSLKGERKGIRLEAIFWQSLDQIAADLDVPRNTLVLWIISAAGHDRSNATSVLRSVIVAYLLDEFEHKKPRRRTPPDTSTAMTNSR